MTDKSLQSECECGHYKVDADGTILVITDQKTFLNNIYNRYKRIKVDTVIEIIEILNKAINKECAISILNTYVAKSVHLITENTEEANDLYAKSLKRGSVRKRSRIGL